MTSKDLGTIIEIKKAMAKVKNAPKIHALKMKEVAQGAHVDPAANKFTHGKGAP